MGPLGAHIFEVIGSTLEVLLKISYCKCVFLFLQFFFRTIVSGNIGFTSIELGEVHDLSHNISQSWIVLFAVALQRPMSYILYRGAAAADGSTIFWEIRSFEMTFA